MMFFQDVEHKGRFFFDITARHTLVDTATFRRGVLMLEITEKRFWLPMHKALVVCIRSTIPY